MREVEAAIYVHFGRTVQIKDIFEVGAGANGSAHYVAHDDSGQLWGLKASVRGVAEGTEREALLAKLARLLAIPNAPDTILCVQGAFLFRSGLRFAITPWLADAKPLNGLQEGIGFGFLPSSNLP